jgi:hypothetical protein
MVNLMNGKMHNLKRIISLAVLAPMIFVLTACVGSQTSGNSALAGLGTGSSTAGLANQSLENKLAVGTLKLENTPQAVTAEQAKELLLLWKAVKSLSASTTTASEETAALYQQIQDTMTAEQLQAIQSFSLTQEDISALMKQYQLSGRQTTTTTKTSGSSSSSSSQSAQAGGPGGEMMGGGMPGGGMGGEMGAIMGGGQPNSQSSSQSTKSSTTVKTTTVNTNLIFADAVIQILKERVNS